jgi:hypothetical protein
LIWMNFPKQVFDNILNKSWDGPTQFLAWVVAFLILLTLTPLRKRFLKALAHAWFGSSRHGPRRVASIVLSLPLRQTAMVSGYPVPHSALESAAILMFVCGQAHGCLFARPWKEGSARQLLR